jgi:formate dehydrogenase major subunit
VRTTCCAQALGLHTSSFIQGSTDIATLYNLLPGYLVTPSALRGEYDLDTYMQHNFQEAGWWVHYPEYFVSLMKAWYGDAATAENEYAFNYLPKVVEDHSDLAMFVTMKDGKMKGFFSLGQNPAAGGVNAGFHRAALEKLDWMVVRDLYEIETAAFWKRPGIDPTSIPTEVIFLPAASHVEKEGSFTKMQWSGKELRPGSITGISDLTRAPGLLISFFMVPPSVFRAAGSGSPVAVPQQTLPGA